MYESHYNAEYFEWQRRVGEFGGKANLFKFEEYIEDNSDILDFGCGGGICRRLQRRGAADVEKYSYEWNENWH